MNTSKTPRELPFVGRDAPGDPYSFWRLPEHGGYLENTVTGRDMAQIYLDYLAEANQQPPILPQIAIDAMLSPDISPARRGQIVGFFSHLEKALAKAAYLRRAPGA